MANLTKHLEKVQLDVEKLVEKGFSGPAVIDWEDWRPLFERNWDSKLIYQKRSMELVKKRFPHLPEKEIVEISKFEFNKSAREFMEKTINLCKKIRPLAKWGFYLFPQCYQYSGSVKCSKKTQDDNNKLDWLFKKSTALFPSAYLNPNLHPMGQWNFVQSRIMESIRVRKSINQLKKPLYLYSRYNYNTSTSFYKLVNILVCKLFSEFSIKFRA